MRYSVPLARRPRLSLIALMFALLLTTVGLIWAYGLSHPLESIFLSFIGGVEPFILIAVPLFIFAGELLSQGGVGTRIVQFARELQRIPRVTLRERSLGRYRG